MEFMNLICLLVSLGMLFWLYIFDVKNSVTQFITFVIMLISNFGYFFLAISSNVEEAILAQKIAYVGGIFLPVFYFFLVLEICHVKLNRFAGDIWHCMYHRKKWAILQIHKYSYDRWSYIY